MKPSTSVIDSKTLNCMALPPVTQHSKVIAAEGEKRSSAALKEAADVLMDSPLALHLRYLQTLNAISAEKNSTIIFPLPLGLIQSLLRRE
ncbi:unnamed protein product [Hydatigera taeniaeformis]|uniref:NR LBD domain-containing protein n=1 Tax=Hydatigena taeniaeformis TaxID=6205 RepID=A0A0R3WYQ3_HYDTA|nr:unnamed protein product [Hydatigera taeniaeformis]